MVMQKITCSFLRIAAFIRQYKLENRITKNISQIDEFCFMVCDFLSAICESGLDQLTANQDKKFFKQYVFMQFNRKLTNNMTPKKEDKNKYYKRINQQIKMLISTSFLMLRPPKVMSKTLLRSKKHFSNF